MLQNKLLSIGIIAIVLVVSFFGVRILSKKVDEKRAVSKDEAFLSSSTDKRILAAQEHIKKLSNRPEGYNQLASAYMQIARETGDFGLNTKAEAALNRSLEIDANDFLALKLKAKLHISFHRFQEALDLARKLKERYANDSEIYGVMTDANVELGNYKEAVQSAQQMVDLKPNMSSYARVSHLRSLHGDSNGAIEAMKFAVKIADPQNKENFAWCLVHLGDEYFKIGRYNDAEKEYDKALAVFPNYHLALAAKGNVLAANNDFETALKFLKDAQDRVPSTETAITIANIYLRLNKTDEAKKQFEFVEFVEQKLNPTNEQRRLALFWAEHDIKLDEALAIAEREYAQRKDIYTADTLAWCLYKKGRLRESKTAIDAALRLGTRDARIYFHAGMIAKDTGDTKEAKRYLELALKTNPSFDLIQADRAKQMLSNAETRTK
jgi:tetratricopeptide (TPR) repeat protein